MGITLTLDSHTLNDDDTLQAYCHEDCYAPNDIVCIQRSTFDSCNDTWHQIVPTTSEPLCFTIEDGAITADHGLKEVIADVDTRTISIRQGRARFTGKLVDGNLVWSQKGLDGTEKSKFVLGRYVPELAKVEPRCP